jgi:hypothetical protein
MDFSTNLFLSMLFGSVGFGYFIYGKKQSKFIPLLVGLALCGYPYFVSNIYVMLLIGVVLIALPFLVKG